VAVNAVDKLQFLSFIFAVLLLITVYIIALRLGRVIVHQHTRVMVKLVQMFLIYHDFSGFLYGD